MARIQLHIENISTMASQSAQDQAGMEDEFIETLSRHQEGLRESVLQVDQRIGRVEELLKAQSKRLQDDQSTQLGPFYKAPPPYQRRKSSQLQAKMVDLPLLTMLRG